MINFQIILILFLALLSLSNKKVLNLIKKKEKKTRKSITINF